MKVLVTGSAGHLGEALMLKLRELRYDVAGLDVKPSPYTTRVGSITDEAVVRASLRGVSTVFHTATLHKPHVGTHSHQQFIDTNISGTLTLLQGAVAAGVKNFIFTSTTSVFGDALIPPPGEPAAWITEDVTPAPKNIYGVTKTAAEDLCQLYHRNQHLACIVLRTSRFFPEADDNPDMRNAYTDENIKLNEYLFRRVDVEDAVTAHLAAMARAQQLGFGKYIISATTPFSKHDLPQLRVDAAAVVKRLVPAYEAAFGPRGWKMFPSIDRVYVNTRAREHLGWQPAFDFASRVAMLQNNGSIKSPLAEKIGSKGYHDERFGNGPYPL